MKIVFPMTGPNRFADEQYSYPKPIIDIAGRTMFEHAIAAYQAIPNVEIISIVNQADAKEYNLDLVIKRATEEMSSSVRVLAGQTAGALCTVLLVSDSFSDEELIISNYDQNLGFDVSDSLDFFREYEADFGVVSFDSVHPKWSYVRMDEAGFVIESAEKKPISKHALVGLYYFKRASDFVKAAKSVILASGSDRKQFYLSEAINALVLAGLKGVCFKINKDQYCNFYDSSELRDFVNKQSDMKITTVRKLTENYIKAFDSCDIESISDLLVDEAILYDPNVGEIKSKKAIIKFITKLYSENDQINFVSKKLFVDGNQSVIVFLLTLGSTVVKGVDLLVWEDNKITRIDAYLEVL